MAIAALFMQGASGVLNAVGSYRGGQAQDQAYQYGAAVARNNALVAEQNAKLIEAQGSESIYRAREETAQTIGLERAGFGASGVDVNRGSAGRTQEDTARVGAANELTIRNNVAREAYAHRVQAVNFENEAKADTVAGANALQAGKLGALTSLVSGASSTASKWVQFKAIS